MTLKSISDQLLKIANLNGNRLAAKLAADLLLLRSLSVFI